MKTTSLILFFCSLFFFISCSEDDFIDINDLVNDEPMDIDIDIDIDQSEGIIGSWLLTEFNIDEPIDIDGNGVADPNLINETNCPTNDVIIFNADGTGISTSEDFMSLTVTIDMVNNVTTYESECEAEMSSEMFTWTQTDNQIDILLDDGSMFASFLNMDQLTFSAPLPIFTSDGDLDSTPNIEFVYIKQ